MGRSFVKCLATLVMAVFIAGPLSASEGSDSANELASLLKGYESYQADFIQIVVNENGNKVQETRGSLKAKRPGLFYWETSAPLSQFIVSNGETVEVYDPDLEQVTIDDVAISLIARAGDGSMRDTVSGMHKMCRIPRKGLEISLG